MMKNTENQLEYGNRKYGKQKMLGARQVKSRVIMFLLIFGVAFVSILSVGHHEVAGKKAVIKESNINKKKANIEVDNKRLQLLGAEVQSEQRQNYIDPNKPMVALTFDDGPGVRTMELLKVLEKNGARATFFTCGVNLTRRGIDTKNILKKMKDIGCDISNHTMDHKQLSTLSKKEIRSQVKGVNEIVRTYIGEDAAQLRPPYGDGIHNKKVIKNVGMPMICWSIDTLDWQTKSKKKTVKAVMKNVQDGDIILMHDIHSWSVDAAMEMIPKLIKKGYQLVTVSEMARARGVELENGKTYFNFRP